MTVAPSKGARPSSNRSPPHAAGMAALLEPRRNDRKGSEPALDRPLLAAAFAAQVTIMGIQMHRR